MYSRLDTGLVGLPAGGLVASRPWLERVRLEPELPDFELDLRRVFED
jgi:hypothetical protein